MSTPLFNIFNQYNKYMFIYKENESAVKSVKERMIHGTGIRFGSPESVDVDNEWFHPEGEYGLENGSTRPYLLEHGSSSVFGKNVVAKTIYEKTEHGWEYDALFFDTDIGNKAFNEIVSKPYKSSAGAAAHTVATSEVKATRRLDVWLVAEQSGTQFPADRENDRIVPLKSNEFAFILQALQQNQETFVKTLIQSQEAAAQLLVDNLSTQWQGKTEALANALLSLKESFSNDAVANADGTPYVIDAKFLEELEKFAQPIQIINL